jgi:hypothetical protein
MKNDSKKPTLQSKAGFFIVEPKQYKFENSSFFIINSSLKCFTISLVF